jgi:hypothetical protein
MRDPVASHTNDASAGVLALVFLLYFVAGVTTGLHILLMSGANNSLHPLQMVGLLGSVGLLIGAYLSLFQPDAAAKMALLASLLLWCFYGPAIAKAMSPKVHTPSAGLAQLERVYRTVGPPVLWFKRQAVKATSGRSVQSALIQRIVPRN